jgi:hypothetical protein
VKKKKTVHWSKLPRTKLISAVKRLELANAKLKTQLAECRETKLLNERQELLAQQLIDSVKLVDGPPADLRECVVHVTQEPLKFPWEKT